MPALDTLTTRARLRNPPLVANLTLSLAAFVTGVLLLLTVEILLRRANPRYLDGFGLDDMSYLHVHSEKLGWLPQPGYRHADPLTTINQSAYRGREVPLDRVRGRTRVLMLGDSLAFGYGVADHETSSSLMEVLDPSLEVVNLAVQGFGTDQALLRFETEGLRFRADVAILNFCLANDFRDNGARRAIYDGAYPKPFFTLVGGELVLHDSHLALSPVERLTLFLHRRSVLFHHLRRLVTQEAAGVAEGSRVQVPARDVTVALLGRFAKVARESNVRPIVVIYPNLREFLAPSRKPSIVLDAPGLAEVQRLDLRPRLEARGMTAETFDSYSFDGSFHATAKGHRLVAEILADEVRHGRVAAR